MNSILRFSGLVSLILFACAFSQATNAQDCERIFFSEYVEGRGNNKALEIYNPSASTVDLSDYRLERYSNGDNAASDLYKFQLSGVMPANTVFVIVLDKRDTTWVPGDSGYEQPVDDALAAVANSFICPNYEDNRTMYFNGNDAMMLREIATNDVVDVIGKIGEDPGAGGWADMTTNHTLIRKTSIVTGDTNPVDEYPVVDQWEGIDRFGPDSLTVYDNLGTHTCDCGTSSLSEREVRAALDIFPNPVTGDEVFIRGDEAIREVILHNLAGQAIMCERLLSDGLINISLSEVPAGMYLLEVVLDSGVRATQRVVRK